MQYPIVVCLSGPEKTRAKAELALEKARLTLIPPGEWPIQRQSNQAEHWPHLTPIRLAWDNDEQAYLPPEGTDPNEEHGFVAVLAETEKAFHRAYECVEPHGWVLRVHHELPEKPKPDPMSELIDTLLHRLDSQEQRIADLTRRLGGHPSIGGAGFETGAGEFMQLGSYSAAQMRRSVFSWAARNTSTVGSATANTPGAISGGLFGSTDMQLSANVSGLVVNISTGECLIPGQEAANQGGYHGFYSTSGSVTLATANATNPRIDLVCATSGDASYTLPSGGTSGAVTIQAVTGTPTSGATLSNLSGAPTLPLSSLLLGYVLVPANATNLTGANIANKATVALLQAASPSVVSGTTVNAPVVARGTGSVGSNSVYNPTVTITHGLAGTPTVCAVFTTGTPALTFAGSQTSTTFVGSFQFVAVSGGNYVTFIPGNFTYEWLAIL